ncbi:MAG: DNA polymerase III subunit beta, partial [candidate division WOR-3 bacterium]
VANGRLILAGTDLDTYVRKEFALEGKNEDGQAILPCRKLTEIVREIQGDRVTFYSKENNVHLEADNIRATFVRLDPAEYPEAPKLPEGVVFEFPLPTLFELFQSCSFAVSKEETRPAMTGINWEVSKTETRMVATDGHRLAFVSRKGKFAAKFKAIVTGKVLSALPQGEESVTVYADPTRIGFKFQDTLIITKVIEGPYPDYERVIPKAYPSRAVMNREDFMAVLRRAAVLAHPVGRLVTLEFKKNRLTVRAETPELGKSEEQTGCDYSGEELHIGFNVGYLLEMLRHMSSEKVALELSTPLSPGVLKPVEPKPDTEEVFLLMPIRLD